ncbi:unnamed protein product [Thelazia callipaeda]|uniref:Uncharacterized protein n=1 Tax=Thelazia callipaeda TaxID=103827 RepID=A0A0N5D2Q6_THECL|nr:unnamed protein product [Thelazia callipaeda]
MNTMNEQAIHISPSDQFHGFPSRFFRTRKGRLSKIIIIEVNNKNFGTVWPKLLDSVTNATFISIDLELSGLGIPKGWHIKSLEEQYGVIRKSAQSHSVLSFGISTFRLIKRKETKAKKNIVFKCQVFNILTLQSPSFVVETTGLQFLLKHKFDFNRLIDLGISYDNISKDVSLLVLINVNFGFLINFAEFSDVMLVSMWFETSRLLNFFLSS